MKELILYLATVAFAHGCASRSAPSAATTDSPASPSSREARPAVLNTALREDPPLPGESKDGWAGLDAPAKAPAHDHGAAHGDHGPAHGDHGPAHGDQPAPYTCPMHPEVASDGPGSCPECGMKLVPKTSEKRDDAR